MKKILTTIAALLMMAASNTTLMAETTSEALKADFSAKESKSTYYQMGWDNQEEYNTWTYTQTHATNTWYMGEAPTLYGTTPFSTIDASSTHSLCIRYDNAYMKESATSPSLQIRPQSEVDFYVCFSGVWLIYADWKLIVHDDTDNTQTQLVSGFEWAQTNAYTGPNWIHFNYALTQFEGHACRFEFLYEGNGGDDLAIDGFKVKNTDDSDEAVITIEKGKSVHFVNKSTGDPDTYQWIFEGGNIQRSTLKNPIITYNTCGTFGVRLTVKRGSESDTKVRSQYVRVKVDAPAAHIGLPLNAYLSPWVAAFVPTNVPVQYRDLSENKPDTWAWSFEGGTPATSTEQNPTVTYQQPGRFGLELNVSNDAGSDRDFMVNAIQAGGACDVWNIEPEESGSVAAIGLSVFGYYAGSNTLGMDAFAEKMMAPAAAATIDTITVYFAHTEAQDPNRLITASIRKADAEGKPGELLGSAQLKIADLAYDANNVVPSYFVPDAPIAVEGEFFICLSGFPCDSGQDNVSVLCVRRNQGEKNTVYHWLEDEDAQGNRLGTHTWYANDADPLSMAVTAHLKYDSDGDGDGRDDKFIFDPAGEEQIYVMGLYSYDMTNSKFVRATSLKSEVRFANDGKTVYFKDITKGLKVQTWVKGTIDNDTIRIQGGQPLAYYRGQYEIMFAPMCYTDSTGNLEAQDEFKLVIKGDSLVSPTFEEGIFQAACGYVYINENTQGFLSLDVDHGMRKLTENNGKLVEAPADIEPQDFVYSYLTSRGNLFKRKVKVMEQADTLYMQLSTCATNAYVKGVIDRTVTSGPNVWLESGQPITDSTFVYFYSLADAVYDPESHDLTDFTPATEGCRLTWDAQTREMTSTADVLGVDYVDGMDMCMDYIFNPALKPYGGDVPATPINPILAKVNIDDDQMFKYICFYEPALDTDSNYINVDRMYYRIYVNDSLLTFTPGTYMNLASSTTDMPYGFADGFDFYVYGEQHYVYLYSEHIESVGVQSVYKVGDVIGTSEIVTFRVEHETDPDPNKKDNDLALYNMRVKHRMLKPGEPVEITGKIKNAGRNTVMGYKLKYTYNGETHVKNVSKALDPNKCDEITISLEHGISTPTNNLPVELNLVLSSIQDDNTANNDTTLFFSIYEESFTTPTLLLEEFTSENCGWCPYGAYRVEQAIAAGNLEEKVIWACHHDGFAVDWLTAPQSTEYLVMYGGSPFAPAMMLNRDVNLSDEEYPVFSIGSIEEVQASLENALTQPCFVKVNVNSCLSNADQDKASIDVTIEPSASFAGQCTNPRLTLFVVEDHIKARKQKTYDSHKIEYHHNALRTTLTDTWGDAIDLSNGETKTIHTTYEVPSTYNIDNLKVIAFVHEYSEDVNSRTIFNSAICNIDGSTGIEPIHADGNATLRSKCFYNLQGQKIDRPMRGLFIEQGSVRYRRE